MKILKPGDISRIPSPERLMRGNCSTCLAQVECQQQEAAENAQANAATFWTIACPTCGEQIKVWPFKEKA